jgi:hypothetical protein
MAFFSRDTDLPGWFCPIEQIPSAIVNPLSPTRRGDTHVTILPLFLQAAIFMLAAGIINLSRLLYT